MNSYQLLKDAYSDKIFIDSLQQERLNIEAELNNFIKTINDEGFIKIKIFENLESRVKSEESFCEKIKRKDYINKWDVPLNKKDIQKYIANNLPDLIGFRINCFFYEDEKLIYNQLKKYYESEKFSKGYTLNFKEKTLQENGHSIYKVTGKYNETNFEIQIKCSVHNIWGEVDHSRIYKNKHYDPKIISKRSITEEVFNILKSSDQQLQTIFEEEYTKEELIRALFYQYTYEDIAKSENVTVLSSHYQHFFDVFKYDEHLENIKQFVSKKLIAEEYVRKELKVKKSEVITVDEFRSRYIPFEIEIMCKISSLIYTDLNLDHFIMYLIQIIEEDILENGDEFDVAEDAFEAEEDIPDPNNNVFTIYDQYFKKREE